jgi:hypothetical protein
MKIAWQSWNASKPQGRISPVSGRQSDVRLGARKALTKLRPRHLHTVEEHGIAETYDRDASGEFFLANCIGFSAPYENPKRWRCLPINFAKN